MKLWICSIVLLLASTAYADPRDDVKINAVQGLQLKQLGNRAVYSVKVDVENAGGRGNIFVNVVGLNAAGFQIALVPVFGSFEENQTRALTGQTLVNPENGEIVTWQAGSFGKSVAQ